MVRVTRCGSGSRLIASPTTATRSAAMTAVLAAVLADWGGRLVSQSLLGAGRGVLMPVRVNRQVPGHGEDPRPLPVVRHARQLLQVLPYPQEDVLHQVSGRLRIAGPAGEVGVHRGAVRLVEAAELSFPVHGRPGMAPNASVVRACSSPTSPGGAVASPNTEIPATFSRIMASVTPAVMVRSPSTTRLTG